MPVPDVPDYGDSSGLAITLASSIALFSWRRCLQTSDRIYPIHMPSIGAGTKLFSAKTDIAGIELRLRAAKPQAAIREWHAGVQKKRN